MCTHAHINFKLIHSVEAVFNLSSAKSMPEAINVARVLGELPDKKRSPGSHTLMAGRGATILTSKKFICLETMTMGKQWPENGPMYQSRL